MPMSFELIAAVETIPFFCSRAGVAFLKSSRYKDVALSMVEQNPASNSVKSYLLFFSPPSSSPSPSPLVQSRDTNTLSPRPRKRNKASQRMPRNIFIVVLITRRAKCGDFIQTSLPRTIELSIGRLRARRSTRVPANPLFGSRRSPRTRFLIRVRRICLPIFGIRRRLHWRKTAP